MSTEIYVIETYPDVGGAQRFRIEGRTNDAFFEKKMAELVEADPDNRRIESAGKWCVDASTADLSKLHGDLSNGRYREDFNYVDVMPFVMKLLQRAIQAENLKYSSVRERDREREVRRFIDICRYEARSRNVPWLDSAMRELERFY